MHMILPLFQFEPLNPVTISVFSHCLRIAWNLVGHMALLTKAPCDFSLSHAMLS